MALMTIIIYIRVLNRQINYFRAAKVNPIYLSTEDKTLLLTIYNDYTQETHRQNYLINRL